MFYINEITEPKQRSGGLKLRIVQEVSWGLGAQQDHEESRNQNDTGIPTFFCIFCF